MSFPFVTARVLPLISDSAELDVTIGFPRSEKLFKAICTISMGLALEKIVNISSPFDTVKSPLLTRKCQ